MRLSTILVIVCIVPGLGACISPANPSCAVGTGSPVTLFTLYFGKAIYGRGDVSAAEWQVFQDRTITPDLSAGYTSFDANGAWMNPVTRATSLEATKILVAALPDAPVSLAKVNLIRTEYATQFHQQLVGMTTVAACGDF